MNEKEKAKELIEKFKTETSYQYQEYAGANYSTFELDIEVLKQCALIAVDEIETALKSHACLNVHDKKYLQQVKTEIENYKL